MLMRVIAVGSLALVGCATPYGRDQVLGPGGFTETRLAPDAYSVRFRGNGFTSKERASDFVLLRCAELTLQSGYSSFAIEGNSQETQTHQTGFVQHRTYWNGAGFSGYSMPFLWNVQFPRNEVIVRMFSRDAPREAFDARFLYDSIHTKYWPGNRPTVAFERPPPALQIEIETAAPAAPEPAPPTTTVAPDDPRLLHLDQQLFDGEISNDEYRIRRKQILNGA